MKLNPVLISGVGFAITAISFIVAYVFGKSQFVTILFYIGFTVGSIGVLKGFFTFRSDKE